MTTWLFIAGVSLDLAGAALVAWTINRRSVDETREEAGTRFDGNLWIIAFRLREQAYVRAGLALLGAGFLLQLSGYMTRLSASGAVLAAVLAAAVFITALYTAARIAKRIVPVEHVPRSELPDGLEDERHQYNLRDAAGIHWWRHAWVTRMRGLEIAKSEETVEPHVAQGRWLFECPRCKAAGTSGVSMVTPTIDTAVCLTCGTEFKAKFPKEIGLIEELLLQRPQATNRNWTSRESVEDLRVENDAHGV